MFPFVCKAYTVDQYGDLTTYLKTLEYNHLFVPKFIVVHNTAPPTLKDYANWQKPTPKHGPVSDEQWAHNLEGFYKKNGAAVPTSLQRRRAVSFSIRPTMQACTRLRGTKYHGASRR